MKTLKEAFRPVVQVKFARTNREFLMAINNNIEKNGCLNTKGKDRERNEHFEITFVGTLDGSECQYYFTQEEDDHISSVLMLQQNTDAKLIAMHTLETHPRFRGRNYAPSLLYTAMQQVENSCETLYVSEFQQGGWDHIARKLPKLHQQFPTLKVLYNMDALGLNEIENHAVGGKSPYVIERKGGRFSFERVIRFV